MKNKSLFFCIVALEIVSTGIAFAQDSTQAAPVIGLTASLQSSQLDMLMPIWVNNNISIAPMLGLAWEDGSGADLHLGIEPRLYLNRNRVSPYIGLQAGMFDVIPASGTGISSTKDWLLGLAFGGEYFVDEHFSVGVESQGNFTFSDPKSTRFGNPGKTNFNTAAAVFATVYF